LPVLCSERRSGDFCGVALPVDPFRGGDADVFGEAEDGKDFLE